MKEDNGAEKLNMEDAKKLFKTTNLAASGVIDGLRKLWEERQELYQKLYWLPNSDHNRMERLKMEIMWLEHDLGKSKPRSLEELRPRMPNFLNLSESQRNKGPRGIQVYLYIDKIRHQSRLRKDRMDMEYLQQVQDELLSSKKSGDMITNGTEELHDLAKSLIFRIQHGSNNQAKEKKLFREMKNVEETRKIYTAPEQEPTRDWYRGEFEGSKQALDRRKAMQHKLNIRLNDIDEIKMQQVGRKAKERHLKARLQTVDKTISSLEKEFEKLNSKRIEACQLAYKLKINQNNEPESCHMEYLSLMAEAKQLVRKGCFSGMEKLFHRLRRYESLVLQQIELLVTTGGQICD